jgi:hypothetical protein
LRNPIGQLPIPGGGVFEIFSMKMGIAWNSLFFWTKKGYDIGVSNNRSGAVVRLSLIDLGGCCRSSELIRLDIFSVG